MENGERAPNRPSLFSKLRTFFVRNPAQQPVVPPAPEQVLTAIINPLTTADAINEQIDRTPIELPTIEALPIEHQDAAVPETWNFKEKKKEGLRIAGIDTHPSRRFLSFVLPDKPPHPWEIEKQYGEYFFDSDGTPTTWLRHIGGKTKVRLGRDIKTYYTIDDELVKGGSSPIGDIEIHFEQYKKPVTGVPADLLCIATYGLKEGLSGITFGRAFIDDKDAEIRGPMVRIVQDREAPSGFRFYNESIFESGKRIPRQIVSPQEIYTLDDQGNRLFRFALHRNEEGILMAEQEHIPTGIVKVFITPTHIDRNKISQVVYGPRTTQAHLTDKNYIPTWTLLDRVIGASMGYRFPKISSRDAAANHFTPDKNAA